LDKNGKEKKDLDKFGQVVFQPNPSLTATKMTNINEEEALRAHQSKLLEAICLKDLPKNEIYEMQDGTSVVSHDLRYAHFFTQICLDQKDLLEELARQEENFFLVRKEVRRSKRKYLAKVDQLSSILKKRLDKPDTDSEDEYPASEGSFQIRRT
jgi:hypothetical protein